MEREKSENVKEEEFKARLVTIRQGREFGAMLKRILNARLRSLFFNI